MTKPTIYFYHNPKRNKMLKDSIIKARHILNHGRTVCFSIALDEASRYKTGAADGVAAYLAKVFEDRKIHTVQVINKLEVTIR